MTTKTTPKGITEKALKAHTIREQRVRWTRSLMTKEQRDRVAAELKAINGGKK